MYVQTHEIAQRPQHFINKRLNLTHLNLKQQIQTISPYLHLINIKINGFMESKQIQTITSIHILITNDKKTVQIIINTIKIKIKVNK
jgi:hypothetical protein